MGLTGKVVLQGLIQKNLSGGVGGHDNVLF